MDPDTEPNPDDENIELFTKIEPLEDAARQIGLYLEEAGVIQNQTGEQAIFVNFAIGDVAFSDRVQHPERYTVDTEFRNMQTNMARDDFLDARARIAEALKKGEDPFAQQDEDE